MYSNVLTICWKDETYSYNYEHSHTFDHEHRHTKHMMKFEQMYDCVDRPPGKSKVT